MHLLLGDGDHVLFALLERGNARSLDREHTLTKETDQGHLLRTLTKEPQTLNPEIN